MKIMVIRLEELMQEIRKDYPISEQARLAKYNAYYDQCDLDLAKAGVLNSFICKPVVQKDQKAIETRLASINALKRFYQSMDMRKELIGLLLDVNDFLETAKAEYGTMKVLVYQSRMILSNEFFNALREDLEYIHLNSSSETPRIKLRAARRVSTLHEVLLDYAPEHASEFARFHKELFDYWAENL